MAWQSTSKFSKNSNQEAKPEAPEELKVKQKEPEEESQKASPEEIEATKQMYLGGRSIDSIAEDGARSRATLFRWKKEGNWDLEKNRKLATAQKLLKALAFYEDPSVSEQALAESNLQLLLRIQGVHLSKLMESTLNGGAPDLVSVAMSDALNKYSTMLEKLIKSDQSIKSGGKNESTVRVMKYDLAEIMRIRLEYSRKGQPLTEKEAIELLEMKPKA